VDVGEQGTGCEGHIRLGVYASNNNHRDLKAFW
jgi:hypothetical protein